MLLNVEQLKEKFLLCSVCMEEYNENDKHPRLLPCLHTFCLQCVQKLFKGGCIECPNCRIKHVVEYEDFRDIPKDNTRRDLMDFVYVKKSSRLLCQSCEKKEAKVIHRCKECAEFLCDECSNAHRKTNLTKQHTLMTMEELRAMETLEAFCHPTKCEEHGDNVLSLYCSKQGCEKPICITCALVQHKENQGHELQDVNVISKKQMEEVSSLMKKLDDVGVKVTKVIKNVEIEVENVDENGQDLEKEIDSAFDSYIESLNYRRQKIKNDLKNKVETKHQILVNQKLTLEEHKNNIEKALEFADQSLAYTNPSAFLQIDKTIITRLDKLLTTQFDDTPYELATVGFKNVGMMTELQRAINHHTKIWSVSIYPPKTLIEIQGRCVIKEVITFYVTPRDYQGRKCEESVGHLKAAVFTPGSNDDESGIKVRVEDPNAASGGRHRVTFVPIKQGLHYIEIKVANTIAGKLSFEVMTEENRTVSNVDVNTLKNVKLTEFCFDPIKCHKDVTITPDGKTFLNSPTQVDNVGSNAFQKYKGVMSDTPLSGPGTIYYELNLRFTVRRPLEKSNLVFEMGLARKSAIDNKIHVDGQPFAWSVIGAHHSECDAICLHIAHKNACVYHQKLSTNTTDASVSKTFGFLLDTDKNQLSIYSCEEGRSVCIMDDVDCSEPLFPVVAGYNPYQIEVSINLRTGKCLRSEKPKEIAHAM